MKSYSFKLWRIMQGVQSKNPATRFRALAALNDLREKSITPRIIMLEKMVKEAAGTFPEPVEIWDDPSFHLLRFVSNFNLHDIAKTMIDNYRAFSPAARGQVIRYLCELDGRKYRKMIGELLEDSFSDNTAILPLDALFEEPAIVKSLVEKFYQKIEDEHYKIYFYQMLSYCLKNGYLLQFKPSYMGPILLKDFQRVKDKYLEYDASYSPKFVYNHWKEGYLETRDQLEMIISLVEFYFNDETAEILRESLTFADPRIKTRASIVSLQKQMAVDEKILSQCAENIETTELLYWELLRINQVHLFPIKGKKQPYFAKSHLFNHVIENSNKLSYPEEIKVLSLVDTENYYGQAVRFYMISYVLENEEKLAWVGAYSIDEDDDSIYMWEGTYVDQHEPSEYSIEEHKRFFLDRRKVDTKDREEITAYRSRPPLLRVNWFIGVAYFWFTFSGWYGYFIQKDTSILSFAINITILGLLFLAWRTTRYITNEVEIKTHTLIYRNWGRSREIPIHHIQKIIIQKEPFLMRLFLRRFETILIYNDKNVIIMKIPAKWVNYDKFSENIYILTTHLTEQPYIEKAS